jgi:hypothetical protein
VNLNIVKLIPVSIPNALNRYQIILKKHKSYENEYRNQKYQRVF